MAFKLACADFTFPLLPHDKVLDLIAMLDFDGVDIGLFEDRSHLWPSRAFANIKKNARELGDKLRSRGLEAADIFLQTALDFTTVAPNHPDLPVRTRAREYFLKTLEFTLECGGKHVSALPGVLFEGESKEASHARCFEELGWRCDEARKAGLVFSVEAHLGSIAPTPAAAMDLVRNTPGLTLTLDYTHFTKLGFTDAEIEVLIPHASHFHARGAAKDRLQTPVKESSIDYARVVSVMKKENYKGYIGIEYTWTEWENCNRTDNVSETILLRDLVSKADHAHKGES
ncbi:MAG: sugar phosphate isomerase/epimerase family protein [Rectinemataceae bacterium]